MFELACSTSLPPSGVFCVTIGSTFGSKKSGRMRVSIASSDSPGAVANTAPFFTACAAAAANASGVAASTNLRAVRLL